MSPSKQAPSPESLSLRMRLLRSGWSVTELARRVKHPRPTVSTALRGERFPRVRKKIEALLPAA